MHISIHIFRAPPLSCGSPIVINLSVQPSIRLSVRPSVRRPSFRPTPVHPSIHSASQLSSTSSWRITPRVRRGKMLTQSTIRGIWRINRSWKCSHWIWYNIPMCPVTWSINILSAMNFLLNYGFISLVLLLCSWIITSSDEQFLIIVNQIKLT